MPNIHPFQFNSVAEYCVHYFKNYNREAWLKIRESRYKQIRDNNFYFDNDAQTFKKEVLRFWESGYGYRNSKIRKNKGGWINFQDENGETVDADGILNELRDGNLELHGNYSWSRLNMGVKNGDPTNDMRELKDKLNYLFNKNKNIIDGFNHILKIPGMGHGKVSALLHIKYPENYGVWNDCTNKAFKIFSKIEPRFIIKESNIGNKYKRINELLKWLLKQYGGGQYKKGFKNLSDVDIFVWYVVDNQPEVIIK